MGPQQIHFECIFCSFEVSVFQRLLILMLCLWPSVLFSAPLDTAERAILAGQYQGAIDTLEPYQPQTQVETMRQLWALSLAYVRIGRSFSAVAPLTRLVAMAPANPIFRLELAAALARNGQTDRALYHFELSKGADLPAPVQAKVQAEIGQLQKSKNWQGYFRFAFIPESNAARRTAAETVTFGGLVFIINPAARSKPANGVEIGFGLAALPVITDTMRARVGFDVQARVYDGAAPDDVTLRANAAILKFGDFGMRTTAEFFATRRMIDKKTYTNSHGIGLSYSRAIGKRANLSGRAEYEIVDYVQSADTVWRKAVDAQFSYAASPQLVFRIGARVENRVSGRVGLAGTGTGLSVGGDYLFTGGLRVGVDVSYDKNTFDGIHALFGVVRKDKKLTANVQLTNANWSFKGFAPVLKIGLERQRSTVVLNRFTNISASIGITRSF